MVKSGRHNYFKNSRLRSVGVKIPFAALLQDDVYRLFLFIFFHVIFYFMLTGRLPDYSANIYIPFLLAGAIILISIVSKPKIISFDNGTKRVYNRNIKQKKSREAKKIIKTPSL